MPYECVDWDGLLTEEERDALDVSREFRWKEKSDIQVAGMLAFYIYTKGKHPFGPEIIRMINLYNDNPVGLVYLSDPVIKPLHGMTNFYNDNPVGLKDLSAPVIKDLLSQMLSRELDERPYVEQALRHPYFLSCEEQIEFVEAVANEPDIKNFKNYPSVVGIELNGKAGRSLLPDDWKLCIHPDDLDIFCEGGRGAASYDGSMYTDCLRLIRNVRQHWGDKPRPPLKGMGTAKSIEEYFLQLFPHLPLVVHQVIRKHSNRRMRRALKKYFPQINRRTEANDV